MLESDRHRVEADVITPRRFWYQARNAYQDQN